ncbi:MAG TPA: aminoglycoside phosphotransferase family protein [Gammaproteobacteria bacterium]|nr:aminoglycoside phosphotransferase family protein [Gammaproteobacteria bacterium]
MESSQLRSLVADLLLDAGIDAGGIDIGLINGGGNNQVFVVHARAGKYLAKVYYASSSDPRNRLGSEFSFLSYAWGIGLRCIPEPICCCPEKNIGLYELVEGRKMVSAELTRQHIIEAGRFIRELNAGPNRDRTLPVASEGCFSIEQHFALIDRRVKRLQNLPDVSDLDRRANLFVDEIEDAWIKVRHGISSGSESIHVQLAIDDRCISPSDFGFHNALLRNPGEICFIDFEYAGWDDPAKMCDDFFFQPAVPAPSDYFNLFVSEALSYSQNRETMVERARLFLPMFHMKWCCIMLNEFLPVAAGRRRFSNPAIDLEQSKRVQLEKAQQFFNSGLA